FCGADFWQDKTQNAVNPIGFTSILTKYWRKSARKKRGSDYARHPNRKYFRIKLFAVHKQKKLTVAGLSLATVVFLNKRA
ncbi:MAG: hypothetical protein IKJ27_08840, partial [Clostridia bacterium]|nr:hypothetical protein [Clostridia bacterium]